MAANKTNNTIQALWVAIGSLCAFGVTLISTMILSRYFDKTDYGTYRQVLYVYQTLLIVFTLGLPKAYAYFLPRVEDCYAKSLINKITRIFYLLGGVFSVLLFIFAPQIAAALKNPDLTSALRIFSPVPFLMLPTMGIEGIYAAYQKNRYMALYNVLTKSLILLCVALPVLFFNGSYKEALMGFVAASFVSFLVATYMKSWCVRGKGAKPTAITNRDIFRFSLPLLFASLWGILTQSADSFFISRFFGTDVFAEFSNGSLQLPFVGMIIGACSTVLMPLFSKKVHENADPKTEILPVWRNVFEKVIKITYPLIVFFLFYATEIMVILYGLEYESSGIFFRINICVNIFTVISYFPILISIGAFKYYKDAHMWRAIVITVLQYFSVKLFNNPYLVVVLSSIGNILMIVAFTYYTANYFKVRVLDVVPMRLCVNILLSSIIILFIANWIYSYCNVNSFRLFDITLMFFVYAIIYAIWTYIAKIEYMSIISPILSKLNQK
ncbi:MAG: oligosaccharide flippase family protein [Bacteroidales bacterium]